MKKLCELVTIATNNEECVVLKVNEDARFDLISLGCFNGNEKMIRLTKGINHTATVFTDKNQYSWSWGHNGYTLVSDDLRKQGRLIQDCLEEDFGIYMRGDRSKIHETLHITSLTDNSNVVHKYQISYEKESDYPCQVRKNGEHFKWFGGVANARNYMKDNFNVLSKKLSQHPVSHFYFEEYEVTSK